MHSRAGIQFVSSNSGEREQFALEWCARCTQDKEINGTVLAEERLPIEADFCPIVAASLGGGGSGMARNAGWRAAVHRVRADASVDNLSDPDETLDR